MDYLIGNMWNYALATLAGTADYKTAAVLVVLLSALMLVIPGRRLSERVATAALVAYLSLVFASTVLLRAPAPGTGIAPYPFWSWAAAYNGDRQLMLEIVENMLLFVPIGVALGYLCRDAGRNQQLAAIAFCAVFSLAIELIQLATGVGLCEFDDVFGNTVGATAGFLAAKLVWRIRSSRHW